METTKAPATLTRCGEHCNATLTLGRELNEHGVATHHLEYDPRPPQDGDRSPWRETGVLCMQMALQAYSDAGATPEQLLVLRTMLEEAENPALGAGARITIAGPAF